MAHTEEVTVGDRGRLVLPASIRNALDLKPGTRMLLIAEDDGSLRLRPYASAAAAGRGLLADMAASRSLVDDLLDTRRREAAAEAAGE